MFFSQHLPWLSLKFYSYSNVREIQQSQLIDIKLYGKRLTLTTPHPGIRTHLVHPHRGLRRGGEKTIWEKLVQENLRPHREWLNEGGHLCPSGLRHGSGGVQPSLPHQSDRNSWLLGLPPLLGTLLLPGHVPHVEGHPAVQSGFLQFNEQIGLWLSLPKSSRILCNIPTLVWHGQLSSFIPKIHHSTSLRQFRNPLIRRRWRSVGWIVFIARYKW